MSLLRLALTLLLSSVSLHGAAFGQQAISVEKTVPPSCPVTTRPSARFIPPWPYPSRPIQGNFGGGFWFGTDKLWTILYDGGTWSNRPHGDAKYTQKLFWFQLGLDPRAETDPELVVTARRLDSPATPVTATDANVGWQREDQPFMAIDVRVPTVGCWEITGHSANTELKYVVWVAE